MSNTRSMRDLIVPTAESLLLPAPSVKLPRFPKLNQITGGLRPKEFSILCGATGIGKTTLCANLSAALIDEKVPHFVASVETGPEDYMRRLFSIYANEDLNTGDPIPPEKFDRVLEQWEGKLANEHTRISLYEDRFSVETLMADLDFEIQNHKIQVAIIDNLNFFMEVTSAEKTIVEMDRVIHELIIFCKTRPVHIIMVMHPKKTDHGRVMSEFDIKGSSTAVQEAHNVFLFNRAGEDLIKSGVATKFDREIMVAKMRRMGRFVRSRLILTSQNGVRYEEGELTR